MNSKGNMKKKQLEYKRVTLEGEIVELHVTSTKSRVYKQSYKGNKETYLNN